MIVDAFRWLYRLKTKGVLQNHGSIERAEATIALGERGGPIDRCNRGSSPFTPSHLPSHILIARGVHLEMLEYYCLSIQIGRPGTSCNSPT